MLFSSVIVPKSKAVLVLVYGMGATAKRFKYLVKHLKKEKISSYTLELQGYGITRGLRGYVPSFQTYLNDLKKLFNKVKKENKGKKIFLLGESMGGLIALRYQLENPQDFDGLIPIVPALFNKMPIPFFRIFLNSYINPKKQYNMPFTTEIITHDKKIQKELDNNELETTIATAALNKEILFNMIKMNLSAKKLQKPIFILAAGKDKLVSTFVTKLFFKKLRIKDKKLNVYQNKYHALTVETGKEKIFKDIENWIISKV